MFKKRILAGLTCSSLLLLAACGNSNSDEGTTEGTASGDVTTVEITWRGSGEGDPIQRFLDDFKEDFEAENDDIELEFTPITGGEDDYFTNLQLNMQSPDTSPDIISQDTYVLNSDANAGYLLNLDDLVAEWDEWDEFIDPAVDAVTAEDGSVYAIPATLDTRGIWYNKTLFEEAGLPTEWEPENWDDIFEAIEAVQENTDAVPWSMNVAQVNAKPTTLQTFMMLLYSTGETLYDEEQGLWNVSGQGLYDAFAFIDEIFNQRDAGPSLSTALNTNYVPAVIQDMLPNDQVAMVLDGNWHIRNFIEGGVAGVENPEDYYGFAPFPTQDGSGEGRVTMTGSWAWSIPDQSQNQEAAWRVLQAMSSEEWQARRVNIEGVLSVREDAAENEEYQSRPLIEEAHASLDNAYFRPKTDDYPAVSTEIANIVEQIASGQIGPEEAAEQYRNAVIGIVGEENTY